MFTIPKACGTRLDLAIPSMAIKYGEYKMTIDENYNLITMTPKCDDETIKVSCGDMQLTFKKGDASFGCTVIQITPPHGDLNCSCSPCQVYKINTEYTNRGYHCVNIHSKSNSTDSQQSSLADENPMSTT